MTKNLNGKKPNLFIGSSRESIKYARAVHAQLNYYAQVTSWFAGAFEVNESTMEALERNLDQSDYAVFIFAPDDVVFSRGKYCFITRDNTLFEMGLFWGKLRRNRVFCILPERVEERTDLIPDTTVHEYHLLSDLQGLTLLRYEWRDDANYKSAVDIACGDIIDKIERHGRYIDPVSVLKQKENDLRRKQRLLHFFLEYNKQSSHFNDDTEKFQVMSEAIRNSFLTVPDYRVTGAAFWKAQGSDGIGQIAGNIGRGEFFPFHTNDTKPGNPRVVIVDAYLNGEWEYYRVGKVVAPSYLLCYPLGKDYVLTVNIAGEEELSSDELNYIRECNSELLDTINHLVGGDWE